MCQAAVPAMQEQRWGRVVAITSGTVRQPIPNLILSNTARAGVTGFLKTLALEVAKDGVTVNSVQPGLHMTDRMRALGVDPERAAADIPAGIHRRERRLRRGVRLPVLRAGQVRRGRRSRSTAGAYRGLQ
jgi:3-oxoacyl-[acyl-carrier protein] reductase